MKKILSFFILSSILMSCSNTQKLTSDSFFIMDTIFQVGFFSAQTFSQRQRMSDEAYDVLYTLETNFSVSTEGSFINRLNSTGFSFIDRREYRVLSNALRFCRYTDGAFDITIYPVVETWGFTDQQYRLPTPSEITVALQRVGYDQIELLSSNVNLPEGVHVDLGGILKGYAVDEIVDFLIAEGATGGIVDAGGNLKCFGSKPDGSPWRIGIRHPRMENEIIYAFTATNTVSIATSGDYQRYFITNDTVYHHILSPFTGYPTDNGLVGVSVLDESAETCDALATALFVMGLSDGIRFCESNEIAALFAYESGDDVLISNSSWWNELIADEIPLSDLQ